MPSDFESRFANASAALQGGFGETVTYTPLGSSAVSTTAIISRVEVQTLGPDGVRIERQITAHVPRADVATAKVGDTVACKKRISDSSTTAMKVSRVIGEVGANWEIALQ